MKKLNQMNQEVMNMKKFNFTDAMAYECDHCAEPWNCPMSCETI